MRLLLLILHQSPAEGGGKRPSPGLACSSSPLRPENQSKRAASCRGSVAQAGGDSHGPPEAQSTDCDAAARTWAMPSSASQAAGEGTRLRTSELQSRTLQQADPAAPPDGRLGEPLGCAQQPELGAGCLAHCPDAYMGFCWERARSLTRHPRGFSGHARDRLHLRLTQSSGPPRRECSSDPGHWGRPLRLRVAWWQRGCGFVSSTATMHQALGWAWGPRSWAARPHPQGTCRLCGKAGR